MTNVAALLSEKPDHEFYTLPAEASVLQAIQLMAERHVGSVLVMHAGRPIGIVTERDYARKVILRGRSSAVTVVADVMSSPLLTVSPSDSLNHCMQVMTERRVRHLPVLAGTELVGMLSIGDLLKALLAQQRREIEQLQHYIAG
jgi:CBS domain-containing protein